MWDRALLAECSTLDDRFVGSSCPVELLPKCRWSGYKLSIFLLSLTLLIVLLPPQCVVQPESTLLNIFSIGDIFGKSVFRGKNFLFFPLFSSYICLALRSSVNFLSRNPPEGVLHFSLPMYFCKPNYYHTHLETSVSVKVNINFLK